MTAVLERVNTGDGLTLAVECYRCDAPRAAVVLLHGGGQSRHAWDRTALRLHARGFSVAAYDARGHGDSDWDPEGRYDLDRLGSDLLSVRAQIASGLPVVAVGASLGGLTVLGTHLLAPSDLWDAVVLVDVTPRMEMHGARRVVAFMGAHPDGFDDLEAAAEVIAAYNPHRPRPSNLEGLRRVLRQREDERWVWRWDPAFVSSNLQFLQARGSAGRRSGVRADEQPAGRRRAAGVGSDASRARAAVGRGVRTDGRRLRQVGAARAHSRRVGCRPHDRR